MRNELALRGEQRLALAPRMLQSIEVLQMQTADLLQRLDAELESNEALELVRPGAREPDGDSVPRSRDEERFDADAYRRTGWGDADARHELLQQLPAAGIDLPASIRLQLAFVDAPPDLVDQVSALAARLDERGLLTGDDDELRDAVGGGDFGPALELLQSLEPRGIGARSPIQAVLLQISRADPDFPLIERLLTEQLEAIAHNKLAHVARALGLRRDDVALLLDRIRTLDPLPADRAGAAAVVRPELVVTERDGEVFVAVDDVAIPVLGVNADYEEMCAAPETERRVRSYLRAKLRRARDLISAVSDRQATLRRVGAAVMGRQREFLRAGPTAIRPLRMADVADQLGMHVSTVSRAIAGKYAQTDFGILPLRAFFDGARRRGGRDGDGKGRSAVRAMLRAIIADENPASPLSDEDLVAALARSRVRVARRTVTKYRRELGIPSSWRRRRHES